MQLTLTSDKSSSNSKGAGVFGFLILAIFFMAFAGMGTAAAIKGARLAVAGQLKGGLGLLAIGLFFCVIGYGLLIALYFGLKAKKRTDAIKAAHPDEPWIWRDDWAAGRIPSGNKRGAIAAWVFALFWNAISSPVCLLIVPGELRKGNHMALIALIFPVIGLFLLALAIRQTIRWKKFGQSIFKMLSTPGVIGGQVSGAIETAVKVLPEGGFHVRLRCVHRVTTQTGDSSSTSENILWEDEKIIVKDLLDDPRRSGIPVFFQIPADCRETSTEDSRNAIVWRLEARAKVPGVDYFAQFEIPVFKTTASAPAGVAVDPTIAYQAPVEPYQLPPHSRITVQPAANGGSEFVFPAARNVGPDLMITAFALIWAGAIWFLIVKHAPLIFPLVFGLFEALFLMFLVNAWFKSSRVIADPSGISVISSWLGLRSVRQISANDVADIKTRIGMTSGQTVYYDIHVVNRTGRNLVAASAIKDKREADWLASEMRRQFKVEKQAWSPTIKLPG